jgi:hypothetical protein
MTKANDAAYLRDLARAAMDAGNPHPNQSDGETPMQLVQRMIEAENAASEPDRRRWIRDARMNLRAVLHLPAHRVERAYAAAKEALGEKPYPD